MRQRCASGRVVLFAAVMPWLTFIAWIAYALAACFSFGHWPQNKGESLSPVLTGWFAGSATVGLCFLVFSAPLWFGATFWHWARWNDKGVWRTNVVYLLGWVTTLLLSWIDPNGFGKWYAAI